MQPVALFHANAVALGRKTGSGALDPTPRTFSKKQKRRKKLAAGKKEENIDHKKLNLKEKIAKKQADSIDVKQYVDDMHDKYAINLYKPNHKFQVNLLS